jgi:hypothetical protein
VKLTNIEVQTAVWKRIEAHLQQRLEHMRRNNDGDLNPVETARLRGRISMCKELLDLGQPDQAQVESDE